MRTGARLNGWLQKLMLGLTVAVLVTVDLGAPLFGITAVYAAGHGGESGQSKHPGLVPTPPYIVHMPVVARSPSRSTSVFGVQMYGALDSSAAALDLAQTAGVSWVRWAFSWGSIEPQDTTPGQYDWTVTDASFSAAKAAGLNVIATMTSNPSWAATYSGGRLDRAGVAPFAEFMAAAVERYDGDGKDDAPGSPVVNYWELYNEPDGGDPIRARYGSGYWGPYGADYAQMLCATYHAAKAASPNAKIVLGGLAYDWFQEDGGPFVRAFLDDVLAAGGGRCVDAVAFHYYPVFESVWTPFGPGLSGKAHYLRSKLDAYGLSSLPLLVTEAGYHSNADPSWPSTPEIQAGYVIKLFTQAIASDISTMIWFSWTDLPDYWAANGLLDFNQRPKPAYGALTVARRKLGAAFFERRLSDGETGSPSVEAYLFHPVFGLLYVIWLNGSGTHQIRLPGKIARVSGPADETLAKVLDADDGVADGWITVTAGSGPIYVEIIE